MYPTAFSATVSTNRFDQPVFTVSISQILESGKEKSMTFTSYTILSMYERLHASRSQINSLVSRERPCYLAGVGSTWDELIEQLNLLGFMACLAGSENFPSSFKKMWGSFPYTAGHTTKHLVREFLSS